MTQSPRCTVAVSQQGYPCPLAASDHGAAGPRVCRSQTHKWCFPMAAGSRLSGPRPQLASSGKAAGSG